MLVLTRRIGETIQIGQDITVTVLEVRGSQVRLGTNAPRGIPVHRDSVIKRINEEEAKHAGKRS